ncbi:MAG: uracil-DNA glycosylase [Crenarchaeota archaeon]|nr:MAG: uracil-DNA glycosylase [Thermoproteota archaeon]RDJ32827.1 MAG: uracil-DNA glycosylase [Thermoproteota archaeon]RDJ37996.1 MAG: uracil-DNA glycosylase [Thermoproteota archaeon]RDJ38340.1 MAG: uracil-DNA glycosylase [Thermoproteota archaeon]
MPSIEEIKNKVIKCTNCELCETRTNAVPGKGNVNSKVIFVGEAPGRSEDKNGEPFVGAAGKKLTAALESAGISRDDIYITNVVKCRPPNNRVPNTGEREACSNYLKSEIEEINPEIICIMGNTAYGSILGGTNITKNRGKVVEHQGNRYFITIHPAATIYNQELLDVLKKDMKKIASIIKK